MATLIDYIAASSIFFVVFIGLVSFTTNYLTTIESTMETIDVRDDAFRLLAAVETDSLFACDINKEANKGNTTLYLNFDNTTNGSKGELAASVSGITYSASRCGFAVDINDTDTIVYTSLQNFNLSQGTVMFWLKVGWTSGDNKTYYLFDMGSTSAERLSIFKSKENTVNVSLYSYNGTISNSLTINASGVRSEYWNMSEWHHIAFTYHERNGISLYTDGMLIATNSTPFLLNFTNTNIYIGSDINGVNQSNSSIDELLISDSVFARSRIQSYAGYPLRIGLASTAYKFEVVANNSKAFYINQSQNVSDLALERVQFNISDFIASVIDFNSTYIEDDDGNTISYTRTADVISFGVSLLENQSKTYIVYFDDDSNFTDRSQSLSFSTNKINETIYAVMPFSVLQYKKIMILNSTNYTQLKNVSDIQSDFRITLQGMLDFGAELIEEDIVSLQRYALYQDAQAAIKKGNLVVMTW